MKRHWSAQDTGVTDSGLLELLLLLETAEPRRERKKKTMLLFKHFLAQLKCVCVCVCWKEGSQWALSCCCFLETPKENIFFLTLNQNTLCRFSMPLVSCTRAYSFALSEISRSDRMWKTKPKLLHAEAICVFLHFLTMHKWFSPQRLICVFNCKNIFQETSIICKRNPTLEGGWEITLDLLVDWFALTVNGSMGIYYFHEKRHAYLACCEKWL